MRIWHISCSVAHGKENDCLSLILLMQEILDNHFLRSCTSSIVVSGWTFILNSHCYCTSANHLWRLKHAVVNLHFLAVKVMNYWSHSSQLLAFPELSLGWKHDSVLNQMFCADLNLLGWAETPYLAEMKPRGDMRWCTVELGMVRTQS